VKSKEETGQHEEDETATQHSSDIDQWLVNATQLPQQISPAQIKQISPSALAYLGDAIYELYVRMFYLATTAVGQLPSFCCGSGKSRNTSATFANVNSLLEE